MLAIVFGIVLQQAVPATADQVVWETPARVDAAAVATAGEIPSIPRSARADPYGYERAECSPLIRKQEESLEACQARVRLALAANLGTALPAGLTLAGTSEECRQEAAGGRYALQCGAPPRADRPTETLEERRCETRPRPQAQGGVDWTEDCAPASRGRGNDDDGLKIRLGGRD